MKPDFQNSLCVQYNETKLASELVCDVLQQAFDTGRWRVPGCIRPWTAKSRHGTLPEN